MANIVVLDSNLRDSGTVQSATYKLIDVGGVVGTYEVLDYSSVNHIYNVELGVNDTVYWDDNTGGGPFSGVIPPGNYNQSTLNAAVKVFMDAAAAPNYTFVINANTGIVQVTSTALFNWEFGTSTTASAAILLGLNAVDTGQAGVLVGDFIPNLQTHTHIVIDIPEDGTKHVNLLDGTEHSCVVPLAEDFGDGLLARKLVNYQQTVFFASNLSFINVVQKTEDGLALVNGPRYVLILRKIF